VNDNDSDVIQNLKEMAALAQAQIFVRSQGVDIYIERAFVMATMPGKDGVSGWGAESNHDGLLRMCALAALLESQAAYDPAEHYCAVVSHWTERAEDIAQYVSDTLDVPVVPMLLTPETADAAFTGDPIFCSTYPVSTGLSDNVHRSAVIVGLRDRLRKSRR
jgi:hypothetical protein